MSHPALTGIEEVLSMVDWGDLTLVLAIVQREDASSLIDEINRRGHAATRINASGGFLSVGNVVVLTGVEEYYVQDVLDAIRETCRTRTAYLFHSAGDFVAEGMVGPIEVEVGGAVVFVLPVERYIRIKGRLPVAGVGAARR